MRPFFVGTNDLWASNFNVGINLHQLTALLQYTKQTNISQKMLNSPHIHPGQCSCLKYPF